MYNKYDRESHLIIVKVKGAILESDICNNKILCKFLIFHGKFYLWSMHL